MAEGKTVDFTKPDQVIALLRQRGASLARGSADDTATTADLADAVAVLMFVTAQGMERAVNPGPKIRPARVVPPSVTLM